MTIIERVNKFRSDSHPEHDMELPHYDEQFISLDTYKAIFSETHSPEPLILDKVLSESICSNIISEYPGLEHFDRTYQGKLDLDLRNSEGAFLPEKYHEELFKIIANYVEPHFKVEMRKEFAFNPIINKYPEGSSGFTAHHDCVTEREIRNAVANNKRIFGGDYTMVIFLNTMNQNDGGEFILNDLDNKKIQPICGSLVSHRVDFIHSVNKIKKGERFSLVCRTRKK